MPMLWTAQEKMKNRGPYNSDTCFEFNGDAITWHFDQKDQSFCNNPNQGS